MFYHGLFDFPELSVHLVNGIFSPRKLDSLTDQKGTILASQYCYYELRVKKSCAFHSTARIFVQ